jgi:hypothetical protein
LTAVLKIFVFFGVHTRHEEREKYRQRERDVAIGRRQEFISQEIHFPPVVYQRLKTKNGIQYGTEMQSSSRVSVFLATGIGLCATNSLSVETSSEDVVYSFHGLWSRSKQSGEDHDARLTGPNFGWKSSNERAEAYHEAIWSCLQGNMATLARNRFVGDLEIGV